MKKYTDTMAFDNYKFILKTCASSVCEVTGDDIDLEDSFECDLDEVKNLKPGVVLFSPRKEVWKAYGIEKTIFPDFNFKVLEVYKHGLRLKTSFVYSSYTSTFEIGYAEPKHSESFSFGRYTYYFTLKFMKK